MASYTLITGNIHTDERGAVSFLNSFNLTEIIRMYEIAPSNQTMIRAWQGHENEKKWFYCTQGSFIINLVKIPSFKQPSQDLKTDKIVLSAANPNILAITGGYATGIKAIEPNSKLLVFSNFTVEQSKNDDFRFEPNYWKAQWE
ncbi:hypothetical protein [Maribacter sp. Asnod2-G09]|uniref:hypothetical protein n=1 Tax=Maribacter sp. Asnod2-G09 TaxID=3160577 RepID=UPI0038658C94